MGWRKFKNSIALLAQGYNPRAFLLTRKKTICCECML